MRSIAKLKFTLDFRITGQTAPFLLGLSKGYDKEEGLDVAIGAGSGSVASHRSRVLQAAPRTWAAASAR